MGQTMKIGKHIKETCAFIAISAALVVGFSALYVALWSINYHATHKKGKHG